MKDRTVLTEQAARLLRNHVAGENVDDLMHHWADDWDAITSKSHRADQPAPTVTARLSHINDWHEDLGNVLWWTQPVSEPPHVGSPLDCDWPAYHEWWEPLPSDPTPRDYSAGPRLAPALANPPGPRGDWPVEEPGVLHRLRAEPQGAPCCAVTPLGEIQGCVRRAAGYMAELPELVRDADLSEVRHHAGHILVEMNRIDGLLNEHRDREARSSEATE